MFLETRIVYFIFILVKVDGVHLYELRRGNKVMTIV